jgi:hypothetical protein
MKTILTLAALLLLGASPAMADAPGEFGVSFDLFYSSLDQFGEWIQLEPQYYVWRPLNTSPDWRPYYYGHWAWTPDGWYWVSDEPWAWAAYHYGRWYFDRHYGWVWMPGYDWAPAWVEWRYSDAMVGWAPLGPYAVFRLGFGIHYSRSWVTPHSYWCFVDMQYMGGPLLHRHIHNMHYNSRYLGFTRSVEGVRYENDRIINRGPDRRIIERRGGNSIRESRIIDVRDRSEQRVVRGGERDEIRVYRPHVEEQARGSVRPGRVREAEQKTPLDLRSTDLERRTQERQIRRPGDVRVAPPSEAPTIRQQPAPPDRGTARERSKVQPTPEVRPRVQERTPRGAQPEVRREVQPRQEQKAAVPRQSAEQRAFQKERPTRVQQTPRQERQTERAVRRAESRRMERPRTEGSRTTEDRRERKIR